MHETETAILRVMFELALQSQVLGRRREIGIPDQVGSRVILSVDIVMQQYSVDVALSSCLTRFERVLGIGWQCCHCRHQGGQCC